MSEQSLLQAGSIIKPAAADGAMTLVGAGILSLDRPVNERLMSWRTPDNDFTIKMPLAHLLRHTGDLTVHGFGGYAGTDCRPRVRVGQAGT